MTGRSQAHLEGGLARTAPAKTRAKEFDTAVPSIVGVDPHFETVSDGRTSGDTAS